MKFIKLLFLAVAIFFYGCNSNDTSEKAAADSAKIKTLPKKEIAAEIINKPFSNERFENVIVTKITEDSIAISGKAQVFEATFNWVLKQGNKEIKSGYQTTDAGAPEWGNFKFGLSIASQSDSTMHLVLFESSAKDGSRMSELAIPLGQVQ